MQRFAIEDERKAIKAIDQHNRAVKLKKYRTLKFDHVFSVGQKKYGVLGVIILCDHACYPGEQYLVYNGGLNWQYLDQDYLPDDQETHILLQNRFGLWSKQSRKAFMREWNGRTKIKNSIEPFVIWP